MKRLSTVSGTTKHHHHSHSYSYSTGHNHHNSISSAKTAKLIDGDQEKVFPLHRSITDDSSYSNSYSSSSPITKFVYKLLGLAGPSVRPRIWHKSQSTTSITKSSVISSYKKKHQQDVPTRKQRAIKITTPASPCTLSSSVMNWDRGSLPNSNTYLNEIDPNEDETISVVSCSSNGSSEDSISSDSSSLSSSVVIVNNSPAIEALVSASLLPTIKKDPTIESEFDSMPSVSLEDRKSDTEIVLTEAIAEMIRPYIPRRYRVAQKWKLLYSLDQHGISLNTMYSLMREYDGPCIMIIKDADEQIFGSYLSSTLHSDSHYYGTGECFLWKLTSSSKQQYNDLIPKIKTFPWTGKNDYMILSDSDFIAIGGGNGKFGLWLNSNLEKGYSNTCPTFDNESLSPRAEFECMEMEIWSFCI